jgi:hypothetical protein
MLQAHSLLWYYLWVAPNLLLLFLAMMIWRRKIHKQFPVFLVYAVAVAMEQLTLFVLDIVPSVNGEIWWRTFWAGLLIEAVIKSALIGEMFSALVSSYSSLAKLGKLLITGVGVVLVLAATVVAAYTPKDNTQWIVSGAHLLELAIYLIECGLLLFLFLFAAYFKLHWTRSAFGIALGLGVSACLYLATWALMANGNFSAQYRDLLDMLNLATFHVCVLIWLYYLLIPHESAIASAVPLPEHKLELWNQELERLLHQ